MEIKTPIVLNVNENILDLGDNSVVEVMEKNTYPIEINTNENLDGYKLVVQRQGQISQIELDLELVRKRLLVCKIREKPDGEWENAWSYITQEVKEGETTTTTITYKGSLKKYLPDTMPTFLAGVNRIFEYDIIEVGEIQVTTNEENEITSINFLLENGNINPSPNYEFDTDNSQIKEDLKALPDSPQIQSKLNYPEKIEVSAKIRIDSSSLQVIETLREEENENEDEVVEEVDENLENQNIDLEDDGLTAYIEEEEEELEDLGETTSETEESEENVEEEIGDLILAITNLELSLVAYDEENGQYFYQADIECSQTEVGNLPSNNEDETEGTEGDGQTPETTEGTETDTENTNNHYKFYKENSVEEEYSELEFSGRLEFSFYEDNFEDFKSSITGNLDLKVKAVEIIKIEGSIEDEIEEDDDTDEPNENPDDDDNGIIDDNEIIIDPSIERFIKDENGNEIPYFVTSNFSNDRRRYIRYGVSAESFVNQGDLEGEVIGYILLVTDKEGIFINCETEDGERKNISVYLDEEDNSKLFLDTKNKVFIEDKKNREIKFVPEENEYVYINLKSNIKSVEDSTDLEENEPVALVEEKTENPDTNTSTDIEEKEEKVEYIKNGNILLNHSENSFFDIFINFGVPEFIYEDLDADFFLNQITEDDYKNLYKPKAKEENLSAGLIQIGEYASNGMNEILFGIASENFSTNGVKIVIISNFSNSGWNSLSYNNDRLVIADIKNENEVENDNFSPIFIDKDGNELIGDTNKIYVIRNKANYVASEGKITNIDLYRFLGNSYNKITIEELEEYVAPPEQEQEEE